MSAPPFNLGRPPGPGQSGLSTPQGNADPKKAPGASGAATAATGTGSGAQGVPATRTAVGAEGAFTTTTITFPKSARPTTVTVSISVGSALVQIPTIGGYFVADVVMAANPPRVIDVSILPESTSIGIQTEAAQASVLGFVANFA